MSQKVIVIHGGTEFVMYEDYLEYLKSYPIERILEKDEKRWKDHLAEDLGDAYKVISPEMPHSRNARYAEWVIWFEKFFTLIAQGEEVIFVGHSLGSAFLLKYLSENKMSLTVQSVHLVSAVVDNEGLEQSSDHLKSFVVDLTKVKGSMLDAPTTHIYHSDDDPVVPYTHAERIAQVLPRATLHTFDHHGHFFGEHFPEIVRQIQQLRENSRSPMRYS